MGVVWVGIVAVGVKKDFHECQVDNFGFIQGTVGSFGKILSREGT